MLNGCAACEGLRSKNKPCWRHKDAALEPLAKDDPSLGRVTVPTSFYGAQPVSYPGPGLPAPPYPLPIGTVLQGPGTVWEIVGYQTSGGQNYSCKSPRYGTGVIAHSDVVNGTYPVVQPALPARGSIPDLAAGAVLEDAADASRWEVTSVLKVPHSSGTPLARYDLTRLTGSGAVNRLAYHDEVEAGCYLVLPAPVKQAAAPMPDPLPLGAVLHEAATGRDWEVVGVSLRSGGPSTGHRHNYKVAPHGPATATAGQFPTTCYGDFIDRGMVSLVGTVPVLSAPSPIVKSILASLNQPPGALPVGTVLRSVHSPKGLGDWVVLSAKKDAAGDFEYEVNEAVNPTPGTGVIHQADIDAGDWSVVP